MTQETAEQRERRENAEHRVRLWLDNDEAMYVRGREILARPERAAEGLKTWAAGLLYGGNDAVYRALWRRVLPKNPTGRHVDNGWTVLRETAGKVPPEDFDRLSPRFLAEILDEANELGWDTEAGQ